MNTPVENREYQKEAVHSSLLGIDENGRAQVHMCCASGKTYVQAMTVQEYLSRSPNKDTDRPVFTVFVPNLGLVRQMEKNFKTILGDDVEYLGFGTDKGTKKEKEATPDLMAMTTDPVQANAAINGRTKPLVIFSTYQSSQTLAEALVTHDGKIQPVALSMMDEAHRTAGVKEEDSGFAFPLTDDNMLCENRIFYTSTPNVVDEDPEGKKRVLSMDNEAIYGKKVFDYPYSRALRDGVVAPFRIRVPIISKAEIQTYREVMGLTEGDDRTIISELALRKVMKETGQDRILTFHNSIAQSKAFTDRLKSTFGQEGFNISHLDGESSAAERMNTFEVMQSQSSIVNSVRAVGEGTDAPGIQAILFADSRSSPIEITQNIGRAQRKDPNDPNKVASVICPIVIDESSDLTPEEQILNSDYGEIFRVSEALRASSDVAALSMKAASREYGRTGIAPKDNKLGIELVGGTVLSEDKMNDLEDALNVLTFESVVDSFQQNLGKIERYMRENGTFPHDDHPLSFFLSSAVERKDAGILTEEEAYDVERLSQAQAVIQKTSHAFNIDRLRRAVEEDELEEISEITEDDYPGLNDWIEGRREAYVNQELTREEIDELESNEIWTWNEEEHDLELSQKLRDIFVEHHGVEPTIEGEVGGRAEIAIAVALEEEKERLREEKLSEAADTQKASHAYNLDRLRSAVDVEELDELSEINDDDHPGMSAWIKDRRQAYLNRELTREEIDELESNEIWTWNEEEHDLDLSQKLRDIFVEHHGVQPTIEGEVGGRAEIAIAVAFEHVKEERRQQASIGNLAGAGGSELTPERMKFLEAISKSETIINSDPIIKERNEADLEKMRLDDIDRKEKEAEEKAAEERRKFEENKLEKSTIQRIEDFYGSAGRVPHIHMDAGLEELDLAKNIQEAEKAYFDAYIAAPDQGLNVTDEDAPYARLAAPQRQIAESRYFLRDRSNQPTTVSGSFRRSKDNTQWEFVAEPKEREQTVPLMSTGRRAPKIAFKMHLTPEQEDRIKAMGPDHKVSIQLGRAGKRQEPHLDGKLISIVGGYCQRDEKSYMDFIIGRFEDRAVTGRPEYTDYNLIGGTLDGFKPIDVLNTRVKRQNTSVNKFMDEVEKVRGWARDGKTKEEDFQRLCKTPGFRFFEHNLDGRGLPETFAMIGHKFKGRTLRDPNARIGDNGLANTLKELDKSIVAFNTREKKPLEIQELFDKQPKAIEWILAAAKEHEEMVTPKGKAANLARKQETQE